MKSVVHSSRSGGTHMRPSFCKDFKNLAKSANVGGTCRFRRQCRFRRLPEISVRNPSRSRGMLSGPTFCVDFKNWAQSAIFRRNMPLTTPMPLSTPMPLLTVHGQISLTSICVEWNAHGANFCIDFKHLAKAAISRWKFGQVGIFRISWMSGTLQSNCVGFSKGELASLEIGGR